jgi:hypothetical protein
MDGQESKLDLGLWNGSAVRWVLRRHARSAAISPHEIPRDRNFKHLYGYLDIRCQQASCPRSEEDHKRGDGDHRSGSYVKHAYQVR